MKDIFYLPYINWVVINNVMITQKKPARFQKQV